MSQTPIPDIRELYLHLSEQELAIIEDNLDRYLLLVLRIFERTKLESAQLTEIIGTLPCTPPDSRA